MPGHDDGPQGFPRVPDFNPFPTIANTTPAQPSWLILAIIGAFVIIFPLFWCLITSLLGKAGGRGRLPRCYASGEKPVTGERHSGLSGMIGGVSYKSVLTLHVTADGFFIGVMALFRVGHPRFFIPWSEVISRKPLKRF